MERRLVAVLGGILVVLLAFWAYAAIPSLTGREVQLRLEPVDPTDLLAGEYLTLRYDISSLNASALPSDGNLSYGDTVYVALSDDPIAVPTGVTHEPPAGGLFIRGEAQGDDWRGGEEVVYGIERYYIPEGTGDVRLNSSWTARVRIDSRGNGRVVGVLEDGKEATFAYGK